MARIITFSMPEGEDSWLYEELIKLEKEHGGKSAALQYVLKEYLLLIDNPMALEKLRPSWFVLGKDYSYLGPELQAVAKKFGWKG